jgi:AraC-like DNA-binding protein
MGAHELAVVGLAGSGIGTALSVPMVWPRSARPADVRVLGLAILLTSAIAALISTRITGLVPPVPMVQHAINVLGFCALPLLVVYSWQATSRPLSPRAAAALWAPGAIYILVVSARGLLGFDTRIPFAWLLPAVLGFTTLAAASLTRPRAQVSTPSLVPAVWIVAFVVLLNVAQIVRMELGHVAIVRAIVPLVLAAGFFALVGYLAWRIVTLPPSASAMAAPRYERSGLDRSVAPDLIVRIERALVTDRLFARVDLTLAQLAEASSATPHQVSEALNRYAGVSFHDLLNRLRIDDVKAQLRDPANDRYTIEGIGAAAGFKSRSALYAAFRRLEGTTPAAFREVERPRTGRT